jgi:hypothetical protein
MGEEACWPWVTPWQFEEFFKLFDEPDNLPLAVHCAGGRHRTGTIAALFRLEYDRWSPERALAELHSFEFGRAVPIQEHNLRTYLPRPRPSPAEWQALCEALLPSLPDEGDGDYEALVRLLRMHAELPPVQSAVMHYIQQRQPFAICLAQRLIDSPEGPLLEAATTLAEAVLRDTQPQPLECAMAAAVIADFGNPAQQQRLLAMIEQEPHTSPPTARYEAIVAGVTNRYTPNRIAYLRPLLEDGRARLAPDLSRYRYCDTAVARLSSIIDQNLLLAQHSLEDWEGGRQRAREWFVAQPSHLSPARLQAPSGNKPVLPGDPPGDGELVRNR